MRKVKSTEFISWKLLCAYLASTIIFVLIFSFRKRLFNTQPSTPDEKRKFANKQIIKQFQKAKSLMDNNSVSEFYDEILYCMNKFIQNKLNIDKESFNKENVRQYLESHSVDAATIDNYFSLINDCESTRFSPLSSDSSLADIYDRSLQIINTIDSKIK